MPPKPEYWTLTKEQFNELKAKITETGEKILENLRQYGFTKLKSSNDWLGVTIEKRQIDILTFVGFSLVKESPREFSLILRSWDIKNPAETSVHFYEYSFDNIGSFESDFDSKMATIKKILDNE
jgi:hypothetical protein